jgi:hypothetical protein
MKHIFCNGFQTDRLVKSFLTKLSFPIFILDYQTTFSPLYLFFKRTKIITLNRPVYEYHIIE